MTDQRRLWTTVSMVEIDGGRSHRSAATVDVSEDGVVAMLGSMLGVNGRASRRLQSDIDRGQSVGKLGAKLEVNSRERRRSRTLTPTLSAMTRHYAGRDR